MSKKTYKDYLKLGVMGGMGPETSAAFYQGIIARFQEHGARHNFEFPEMVVHNVPSPDNVEAGVDQELLDYMVRSARLLEQAGMDLIAIPCNSAHVHINAVIECTGVRTLNILQETALAVAKTNIQTVLVVGTKSTLGYGLYPPHLENLGVTAITPSSEDQEILTQIIMSVCDGTVGPHSHEALETVVSHYPDAQGVVLGCTELPLAVGPKGLSLRTFDTLQILIDATYRYCIAGPDPS